MFDPTQGADRLVLMPGAVIDLSYFLGLQEVGALIIDDRRRRPLYFDGRFLTASDLTRDQNYFLSRQADLGRAGGTGIVYGLNVQRPEDGNASAITITRGHGLTASGELVVVPYDWTVALNRIPDIQRLNAALGLSQKPNEAARNRSGLYIVALRAVEYTANPITSYPTSISGNRVTNDGDIIEGVVVTLIPYIDEGGSNAEQRRARVAREVFVLGAEHGLPVDALPLAMVSVDLGGVQWIDNWMVRREVASGRSDLLGMGFAPRVLREAHFHQYTDQLYSIVSQRNGRQQGQRFAASSYFSALPPGGQLPSAAINTDTADFTQTFFPAEVKADLAFVPEDEILALIEDSLLLPPIDLTLRSEELESTAVLVLIPVARAHLRTLVNSLTSLRRDLNPAAPGLIARRSPLEALRSFPRLPRLPTIPTPPADTTLDLWRNALRSVEYLWYVRRRNLHTQVAVAGLARPVSSNEIDDERLLSERLSANPRFITIRERASTLANAEIVSLLAARKFAESPLLLNSAVTELEKESEPAAADQPATLERAAVLKVNERYADLHFGEGITRLEALNPELRENQDVIMTVSDSGVVPKLDELARKLPEAEVTELSREIMELSRAGESARINEVVTTRLNALRSGSTIR